MPRPVSWRLDPAAYPHRETVQTRFQDLDPLGHLNNVAYAAIFETARVKFNHRIGLAGRPGHRWLVANVEINYLAEGHFPADVEIATGIGTVGRRSWQIIALMTQNGVALATCDVVIVMSEPKDTSSLPDDFRGELEPNRAGEVVSRD